MIQGKGKEIKMSEAYCQEITKGVLEIERDFATRELKLAEAKAEYWKAMYEISNSTIDFEKLFAPILTFIGTSIGWGLIFFAYTNLR